MNRTCHRNESLRRSSGLWLVAFVVLAVFMLGIPLLRHFSGAPTYRSATDLPKSAVRFSEGSAELKTPFDMPAVTLYAFPDRECSIDRYGAVGDGKTMNTKAINAAIADCAKDGGGTVSIPAGKWLTGPIHLKNNIRLDLAKEATILGSTNFDDYLPVVFSRYEGLEYYNYSPLIYGNGVRNAAITGSGTIDGNGAVWWGWRDRSRGAAKRLYTMADAGVPVSERVFGTEGNALRPSLLLFSDASSVSVEGVTIKNGPMWTLHFLYSDGILVKDVNIDTEGPNNDGLVFDSSRNAIVEGVTVDTEDDAIAIKSGVDRDGQRVGKPSENIVIKDCHIGRGNGGIAIGSEMSGDVRNILVSGCTFDGTKRGIRAKSFPGRGGIVENVFVDGVDMKNIEQEAILLNMAYDSKNVVDPTTKTPPIFRNFSFRDIDIESAGTAISLIGLSNSTLSGLSFTDIRSRSSVGVGMTDVEEASFRGIDLRASKWPLIHMSDSHDVSFGALTRTPSYRPFVTIDGSRTENIRFEDGYPKRSIRIGADVPKESVSY